MVISTRWEEEEEDDGPGCSHLFKTSPLTADGPSAHPDSATARLWSERKTLQADGFIKQEMSKV